MDDKKRVIKAEELIKRAKETNNVELARKLLGSYDKVELKVIGIHRNKFEFKKKC